MELLDYSGPVQRALRAVFGWHTVQGLLVPRDAHAAGAVLVLSAVLYPYVYLSARASFVQQSVCVLEVARTLGRTSARHVLVGGPAAGAAGARGRRGAGLMECLNDLGAVQYLGVQTLTVSIYTTWLQRSSLGGAAQIALVALLVVLALLVAERAARGGSQLPPHHRALPLDPVLRPGGLARAAAATAFCPAGAGRLRRAVRGAARAGDWRTSRTPARRASGGRRATASASRRWPPS